jgi:hypothetical protein
MESQGGATFTRSFDGALIAEKRFFDTFFVPAFRHRPVDFCRRFSSSSYGMQELVPAKSSSLQSLSSDSYPAGDCN